MFEKVNLKETRFSHIAMFVSSSETPFFKLNNSYVSMC